MLMCTPPRTPASVRAPVRMRVRVWLRLQLRMYMWAAVRGFARVPTCAPLWERRREPRCEPQRRRTIGRVRARRGCRDGLPTRFGDCFQVLEAHHAQHRTGDLRVANVEPHERAQQVGEEDL